MTDADYVKAGRRIAYGHMPGIPFYYSGFVNGTVQLVRTHFGKFVDCSTKEAEMMMCNFERETVHVEYIEDFGKPPHYMLSSDYGYGRGKSLKDCMHNWVNLDDEDDSTEFAVRSRALGASRQRVASHYLPQLRSLQRYPR